MNKASQECCHQIDNYSKGSSVDLRAVGYITMELMQKYINDDRTIGVEEPDFWGQDSKAVAFLRMTSHATLVEQLLKVMFSTLCLIVSNNISIHFFNVVGKRKCLGGSFLSHRSLSVEGLSIQYDLLVDS